MILITGASGTVGTETVRALQAKSADFRVGVRSAEKAAQLGAGWVEFDWDRPATHAAALRGVETLFLLPPVSEEQAAQGKALVGAAKRAGVRRIVKLSVIGADTEPGITIGRMHREVERAMQGSGVAWTILRPTFFMQNFVNFYGLDPRADHTVYMPWGDGKASWVDARDVGEVAATVLTARGHEGKVYDLTGPEALGAQEVLTILGGALGKGYAYVDVPEDAARQAMLDMRMPAWMVDGFMELNGLIKNGYAAGVAPGVRQVLGRAPRAVRDWAEALAAGVSQKS